MRPTSWPLLFVLSVSAAAAAAAEEHAPEMNEIVAHASSRDTKIPIKLVERIETEYKAYLKKQAGGKDEIRREFLGVSAEFTRAHAGAVRENTRVRTPTGGGVIDLADVVTPLRGAFNLKLLVQGADGKPVTTSRVFFVSHARRRILDGEEYGDGCDQFMEITTNFHRQWETSGFGLYSADQRYLTVLGGIFLFVEFKPESLRVASLSFTDSRYPKLLCD